MTDRPARHRSIGERFERLLVRSYVWGPSRQQPEPAGPVPQEPTVDARATVVARSVLMALAVVLPVATAALLIPFRTTLTASTQTLVLVLPVVVVAILAHRVAAVLAAASAALAYDVLLTVPYYSFTIDAAEDIEASIVLGCIGLVVGTLVARELEQRMRSASRAEEVAMFEEVARIAATGRHERLVTATTDGVRSLLGVRSCEWSPGFHGRVGHVMAADGSFDDWQGAALPAGTIELPVVHAGEELGRLLAHTATTAPVSSEERRSALALADVLATGLASAR